jgi:hypothetical protein
MTMNGLTGTLAMFNAAFVLSDEGRQVLAALGGSNEKANADLGRINEVRPRGVPSSLCLSFPAARVRRS